MRFIIPFLTATALCAGGQSLVMGGGRTYRANIPNRAPFVGSALTNESMRWEFRVHGWSPQPGNYGAVTIFTTPGDSVYCLIDSNSFLTCQDWWDATDGVITRVQLDQVNYPDFIATFVRDNTLMQAYLVVCNIGLSSCQQSPVTKIVALGTGPSPWAPLAFTLGSSNVSADLAWFRWRTGVGGGPQNKPRDSDPPANLVDWELDSNGTDSSGNGLNIFLSGASFVNSPTYPPSCVAGIQTTYRAGFPATLDGTGSVSLDGNGALTYYWTELSGPVQPRWRNRASAQPTLDNMIFGSYVFQLTVTDTSGHATTCTVKHGAVATDDNNVVITGKPLTDLIVGPMMRFGTTPWVYYDTLAKQWANNMGRLQGSTFIPPWYSRNQGTISVTNGSLIVTGIGTHFIADLCGGNAAAYVSGTNMIIVNWPIPNTTPQAWGNRNMFVGSCQSDTQITVGENGNITGGWRLTPGTVSGLKWSVMNANSDVGHWRGQSTNVNYYDAVLAFYVMYYRTGIDDYLNYARWLADAWWTQPYIDQGTTCDGVTGGWCLAPRLMSLSGMYLRALDQDEQAGVSGSSPMWQGLETFASGFEHYVKLAAGSLIGDIREEGYQLAFLGMCGIVDPNPVASAACKSALAGTLTKRWGPQQFSDGSWRSPVSDYATIPNIGFQGTVTGSVSVTNGSNIVTGVGTNFTAVNLASEYMVTASNPSVRPFLYQDQTAIQVASVQSDTQLTLVSPYQGVTGSGRTGMWGSNPTLGVGVQPFMSGINAAAMHYSYLALNAYDSSSAAIARNGYLTEVSWISSYGYQGAATKGLWYLVNFSGCTNPGANAQSQALCSVNNAFDTGGRSLEPEVFRAYSFAYMDSRDPATKAMADTMFAANFSQPGDQDFDGINDTNAFDPVGGFGWNVPKWWGFVWGFGGGYTWPAARLGGVSPEQDVTVPIPFNLATYPNATRVRITLTQPTGQAVTTNCTTSPCVVTADARAGSVLMRTTFLDASGLIVAPGEDVPLAIAH